MLQDARVKQLFNNPAQQTLAPLPFLSPSTNLQSLH